MRSRSVNLINLISNQCELLTLMQDKKDSDKSFNKQKFCVADSLLIVDHTYKLRFYVKAQVSERRAKTSYLFLLLVKLVAFTKNYELKANKRINKITLSTRENKYLSPLDKPWERNQSFLCSNRCIAWANLELNKTRGFCSDSKKNHKSLLITFSGGQDSVALLVLLFGIQSQNLLKLNILWNHHLWHKDSFFITRHILKLSFLFKISAHSAIATSSVKTEIQARQWRLKVSRRLSNFYKYQNVMQAHSGTDKIETLLLNLFRGTGNTSPFHSTNFSLNFSQTQKRKLIFSS